LGDVSWRLSHPDEWGFAAIVGDVDDDGYVDLALSTDEFSTEVCFLRGGPGGFPTDTSACLWWPLEHEVDVITAGDVDGDGVPDLLVATTAGEGGRGTLYYGGTGFSWSDPLSLSSDGYSPGPQILPDLTGDGRADLLWRGEHDGLCVIEGARFTAPVDHTSPGARCVEWPATIVWHDPTPWFVSHTGDVDRDGVHDLLVYVSSAEAGIRGEGIAAAFRPTDPGPLLPMW